MSHAARLGDQMSLTFATHRTSFFRCLVVTGGSKTTAPLCGAFLSPGMASQWRDLGIYGESSVVFVSQCTTVMAKHDRVFSYVGFACFACFALPRVERLFGKVLSCLAKKAGRTTLQSALDSFFSFSSVKLALCRHFASREHSCLSY